MERLYESMINSLEGDNSKLQSNLEDLEQEVAILRLEKAKHDKSCGTSSQVTDSGISTDIADLVHRSMNTSLTQSNKATETLAVKTAVKCVATDEDEELLALQRRVAQLDIAVTQGELDRSTLEQQKGGLLDNHKQLSERLTTVESQLQMTRHKLTTLQAVHELVLSKNESMERAVQDANSRLSTELSSKDSLKRQLSNELEKARDESVRLSTEVEVVRQQMSALQAECVGHRQREVDMNSDLTKLTLERSNLQGKVNSLNSELVSQKAQHLSQSLRVQQLEATKAGLEAQTSEFKKDSLELFKQLDEARQEKDDLSQKLGSLHSQLTDSMGSWQRKLQQQEYDHEQVCSLVGE